MPRLASKVPSLYHSLFPDFIEKDVPDEKWATCSNCTLCQSPFSPYINAKCCNYYPHLANYLVGGILQDDRPAMAEGKRRIKELIKQKAGITPYGILPPQGYKEAREKHFITKRKGIVDKVEIEALLCPYLDRGNCTIWDYRENQCATHFCISTAGKTGRHFWKTTNRYLKLAENVLSNYALLQHGFPASTLQTEAIKKINFGLESVNGEIDTGSYEFLWQNWVGKEEELYIRCYESVTALTKEKFKSLCGHNQLILAQGIEELLEKFTHSVIPDSLLLVPETVVTKINSEEISLTLGSKSATVTPIVYTFLQKFNGRHTTKAIIDLAFQVIINLETTIDDLYQKGILIPAIVPISDK